MKSIALTIVLLFAFAIGKAQTNPIARISNYAGNPTFIVDSIEVGQNALNNINPNNIQNINVIRNAKYPNGAIYVTLKNPRALAAASKMVSLQQLTDEQIPAEDKSKTRIYLLDDRLITDTTNLRIDVNAYHNVRIMPAANAPYFKTAMPNTLLIIISTFDPKGHVMIRGTSLE